MKTLLQILLVLGIFNTTLSFAQDPKKMNKSELKEELIILNSKIDSLNQLTQKLTTVKQELQAKISDLEQKSNNNDLEINRLYRFVDEKEKQISQLKEEVQKLSKTISENEVERDRKNLQNLILTKQVDSLLGVITSLHNEQPKLKL